MVPHRPGLLRLTEILSQFCNVRSDQKSAVSEVSADEKLQPERCRMPGIMPCEANDFHAELYDNIRYMSKEKKLLNFRVVSAPLSILQLMIILYLILSVVCERIKCLNANYPLELVDRRLLWPVRMSARGGYMIEKTFENRRFLNPAIITVAFVAALLFILTQYAFGAGTSSRSSSGVEMGKFELAEAELKTLRDLGSDEADELEEFIQKMKNK